MANSLNAPIRFLHKEEILKRENYRPELRVASDQLSHIVGVFNFDPGNSFRCGLNNCRQEHWNGIVIAAKNGLETHCGLNCGAREFPEDFKSKHALFSNALRRMDSIRTVSELKENSARFLKEAESLIGSINSEYRGLQSIRKSLRTPAALNKHIENICRSDGIISISVPLTEDERDASGGKQRFRTQAIGKIQGITAIRDFAKASVEIENLIRELRKIQSLHPEKSSTRVINQYIRFNNSVRGELDFARSFIAEANRFFTLENSEEIKKLAALDGVRESHVVGALKEFGAIANRRNKELN